MAVLINDAPGTGQSGPVPATRGKIEIPGGGLIQLAALSRARPTWAVPVASLVGFAGVAGLPNTIRPLALCPVVFTGGLGWFCSFVPRP